MTLPAEFALIARHFRPLAGEGALDLSDDAALLTPPAGKQLVLAADAMVAGVHFLPDDPPETIGRKLLRVNLSDLAATARRYAPVMGTYDGKLDRYASSHPRTEKRPPLFNLLADPLEHQNLAKDHPELVARLADRLQEWWPVSQRQVLTQWTDTPGEWK